MNGHQIDSTSTQIPHGYHVCDATVQPREQTRAKTQSHSGVNKCTVVDLE